MLLQVFESRGLFLCRRAMDAGELVIAEAHLAFVSGPRHSHQPSPGGGLRNLLRKERATTKTRHGIRQARARARALVATRPTSRACERGSTPPWAATTRRACPRQSAEGPLTPALSGERPNLLW